MKSGTLQDGSSEDGNVSYTTHTHSIGYDASGRTSGAIYGLLHYGSPSTEDQLVVEKQKNYMTRFWYRMQRAHAYTVGGVVLYQFAIPYLSDRQQRHIMENIRYFYHLHRTSGEALTYFTTRGNDTGDSYLGYDNATLVNVAMAQAVQSGNLMSFPAANPARIHARFLSSDITWPTLDARALKLTSNATSIDVEITDYLGALLNSGDYTASWTQLSGPATATFTSPSSASSSVNFPIAGKYRIQLEVVKGAYTLTEPIDVNVLSTPIPAGYAIGEINYHVYENISGSLVSDLKADAKYPDNADIKTTLTRLEGTHSGDNYGSMLQGYIIPQTSGDYTFYISASDTAEFILGDDEATAQKICDLPTSSSGVYEWDKYASQTSSVQSLTHQKEAGGSDHVAVAWTGPGISTPTVIDDSYVALPSTSNASIVQHPVSQTVPAGGDVTFHWTTNHYSSQTQPPT